MWQNLVYKLHVKLLGAELQDTKTAPKLIPCSCVSFLWVWRLPFTAIWRENSAGALTVPRDPGWDAAVQRVSGWETLGKPWRPNTMALSTFHRCTSQGGQREEGCPGASSPLPAAGSLLRPAHGSTTPHQAECRCLRRPALPKPLSRHMQFESSD